MTGPYKGIIWGAMVKPDNGVGMHRNRSCGHRETGMLARRTKNGVVDVVY